MKTKVSFITKMMTVAFALVMTTGVVLADGEITEVFTTGTSNSAAGDFVVRTTNDVFHFQGNVYEVFKVYYDDPSMNLQIAVNAEGKCKSFVAYAADYTLFYTCNRDGFGVRKVMFSNPEAHKRFDKLEYKQQTILSKQRKIEKKDAIELIAAFLPSMQS
ncbi:MAG: hypothetical protein PF450_01200 [Bacteroidales bacterium]|jgi:hypothetical protein|nr:hypothetical protein [Bacteroidales bacterium]